MDGQLTASNLTQYTQVTQIIEGLLTAAAIILGGIWSYMLFVRTRQRYPRANLKHRITHRLLGNKKQLLVLDIVIENTGDVLLSLASAVVRIQQVLPIHASLEDSIHTGEPVPEKENEKEFPWPLLASRKSKWGKGEFEIEPGESDQVTYDFFLDDELETVRVYAYFENEKKKRRKKPIGWGITTLYDLRPRSNSS